MTSKIWSSGVVIDSPWLQDVDTATYTTLPALTTTVSGKLATANNLSELTATASTARSNLGLVIGTNVPSPTGTGASGSWGIGITGNAATATKSTNVAGGNNTTLLGSIPYQSNTDTTALLAPNTAASIKYLTQTGTGTNGAAPVWSTLPATAGTLTAYTRFTASGTWTRAAGTTKAMYRVKGGGGNGAAGNFIAGDSGGGGGEGSEREFFDTSPPASGAVTVGAAASSSSVVGSITVTATGGASGSSTSGGSGATNGGSGGLGKIGASAGNGGSGTTGGIGGGLDGGAGAVAGSGSAGTAGTANTGCGGGGGSDTGSAGGAGGSGVVEIWEYA